MVMPSRRRQSSRAVRMPIQGNPVSGNVVPDIGKDKESNIIELSCDQTMDAWPIPVLADRGSHDASARKDRGESFHGIYHIAIVKYVFDKDAIDAINGNAMLRDFVWKRDL